MTVNISRLEGVQDGWRDGGRLAGGAMREVRESAERCIQG